MIHATCSVNGFALQSVWMYFVWQFGCDCLSYYRQTMTTALALWSFNPFPHMTILQQTTLNIFCQTMENLYNWMDNQWLTVENMVTKEEIWASITSIWGKGLMVRRCNKTVPDCQTPLKRIDVRIFTAISLKFYGQKG